MVVVAAEEEEGVALLDLELLKCLKSLSVQVSRWMEGASPGSTMKSRTAIDQWRAPFAKGSSSWLVLGSKRHRIATPLLK